MAPRILMSRFVWCLTKLWAGYRSLWGDGRDSLNANMLLFFFFTLTATLPCAAIRFLRSAHCGLREQWQFPQVRPLLGIIFADSVHAAIEQMASGLPQAPYWVIEPLRVKPAIEPVSKKTHPVYSETLTKPVSPSNNIPVRATQWRGIKPVLGVSPHFHHDAGRILPGFGEVACLSRMDIYSFIPAFINFT